MLSKCACLGTEYISFSETRILKINIISPYDNKINTLQWEEKHLNAENILKKEKTQATIWIFRTKWLELFAD